MRIRDIFRRKPPIWDTPEWDELSWDEKMALWEKHRKISIVLGLAFIVCLLGSIGWYLSERARGTAGSYDLLVLIVSIVVMGICLYLGKNMLG